MLIRYGFDIELALPQQVTLVTAMDVHPSRRQDVVRETSNFATQSAPVETFVDSFGNVVRRLTPPPGRLALRLSGIVRDRGLRDEVNWSAEQSPLAELPREALPFLMGSRYCETDLLSDFAWSNFGAIQGGWPRVQAICDFVNQRLKFSYADARSTRTAAQALEERIGVCRDFTHLAIALCRCLNIPARYCNGYLGDIGVPADPAPMDFNAWFEAYLDGRWYTFDARHNQPRIGRILIARGRDATDVAMITSFGPHRLTRFDIITDETNMADPALAA